MESGERTKLLIVVGLAVVFVAMGYFRFLHGNIAFFKKTEGAAAVSGLIQVPAVDIKGVQPVAEPQKKAPERPRAKLRDIFAPVKPPAAETAPVAVAAAPLPPLPPLQLAGTIVGGKRPLAVINGRFLRNGELIAGLEVVSITKDQVTLSEKGRTVLLHALTGAEVRTP